MKDRYCTFHRDKKSKKSISFLDVMSYYIYGGMISTKEDILQKLVKKRLDMTERIAGKKTGIVIVVFAFLVIITGVLIAVNLKTDDLFSEYEVQASIENIYSEETRYLPYINGYLHYDRDGAEAVGSKGELLWNISYNMKKPIASINKNYAVVADMGGSEAYIFDESGERKKVAASDAVQEVEVSENGIIAVRIKNQTTDGISVIGADGTKYVDIITNEQKDGFPVDMTLSKDGTRLATLYFIIEDGIVKSQFSFYNFSRVGQNYVDKLVGLYKDDRLAVSTEFIGANHFAIFFEDGIKIYSFKELPEELTEIKPDGQIKSIFFDDGYVGVITSGKKMAYAVKLYTLDGKNVFDAETELEYTAVEMENGEIVLYNAQKIQVWDIAGSMRYEGVLGTDIELVVPIGNFNYVILSKNKMENIRLINTKE